MRVLQTRDEKLQVVFERTAERLSELSKDQKAYEKIMGDLLLQGLLDLFEKNVTVTVRSTDVQLVQGLVDSTAKKYKDMTGRDTSVNVEDGLPKDRCARDRGTQLTAQRGWHCFQLPRRSDPHQQHARGAAAPARERCTYADARKVSSQMLPELRLDVFGPNPDRKCVQYAERLLTAQVLHIGTHLLRQRNYAIYTAAYHTDNSH